MNIKSFVFFATFNSLLVFQLWAGVPLSRMAYNNGGYDGSFFADIAVNDKYAFIGNHPFSHVQPGTANIHVYGISNPNNPVFIKNINLSEDWNGPGENPVNLSDVEVWKGVAYFASDNSAGGGVYVYDVSGEITGTSNEPHLRRITWSFDPNVKGVHNCKVREINGRDYLFLIHIPGIDIWDVTDKNSAPVHVKYYNFNGAAHDASLTYAADGKKILVVASQFNTKISFFDLTNIPNLPTAPYWEFTDPRPGTHNAIMDPGKKYLYVSHELETANGGVTTYALDWQNKINTETSHISFPGVCVHDVHFRHGMLYASWYKGGVKMFSLANPAQPALLQTVDFIEGATGTQGFWGLAFNNKQGYVFASNTGFTSTSNPRRGLFVYRHNGIAAQPIVSSLLLGN